MREAVRSAPRGAEELSSTPDPMRPSRAWWALWGVLAVGLAVGVWLVAVIVVASLWDRDGSLVGLGVALASACALVAWRARRNRELLVGSAVAAMTLLAMVGSTRWPGGIPAAGFGMTLVGACPLPMTDVVILSNGVVRFRTKSHRVTREELEFASQGVDRMIVATGWQGVVEIDDAARVAMGARLEFARTPEAIARYSELRRRGARVALLLHSTC